MGAIKNKTLGKKQGKRLLRNHGIKSMSGLKCSDFSDFPALQCAHSDSLIHLPFYSRQAFFTTAPFLSKFHFWDKKRALSEMRGQELRPTTGCTSVTVTAILRFGNLLLALGRTRQTLCCTELFGISHKKGLFPITAWEFCLTLQPGVRLSSKLCMEHRGVPISGVSGVSLMCRRTKFVLRSPFGS